MTTLTIPETLAERLEDLARLENRPVAEVLTALLELYMQQAAAFDTLAGRFNDDVTDLSTTARQTIQDIFREKHGRPD